MSLSLKAGNAIEVITSLITTLHAIRDREFVFHERDAHLGCSGRTSPTLRACVSSCNVAKFTIGTSARALAIVEVHTDDATY